MNRQKCKMLLLYMAFGAGTTLVNIALFELFYYRLNAGTIVSNVVAWVGAVLFAFVTNKWYVFESKTWDFGITTREFVSFSGCRGFTGLIDLAMMYTTVDLMHQDARLMKLLVNVIVIILNYVGSRFIFKKQWKDRILDDKLLISPKKALTVNAYSTDGKNIIEGIEYKDNVLGVQFHPEIDDTLIRIFSFLAE